MRSPEGQCRIECESSTLASALKQQISTLLKLNPAHAFDLALDPTGASIGEKSIQQLGLKHGDLIYVVMERRIKDTPPPVAFIKQHPVDDFLEKQDGSIRRERDPTYCKHSTHAMCEYCLPLQPYDKSYLAEKKIKHLSFHSHLRQIRDTAKILPVTHPMFVPPLDEVEYTMKNPCPSKTHGPYPEGI